LSLVKNFNLHNHACLGLYSGDTPTCAWNLTLASARLIEHQVGNSPVFGSAAFMQAAVCIVVLLFLEDGLAQVGVGSLRYRAGLRLVISLGTHSCRSWPRKRQHYVSFFLKDHQRLDNFRDAIM
jgi:hypothetical protein